MCLRHSVLLACLNIARFLTRLLLLYPVSPCILLSSFLPSISSTYDSDCSTLLPVLRSAFKTDHLAKDHVSFLRAKIVSHNLRACTLTMDIYIIPVHSLCIERWCTILVYWVKEASVHCPLFRPTPRFLPKFQSPGRGSIHLHRV